MSYGSPLDQKFTRLNNIVGWLVFLCAIFVYYSTVEPTASFWDCSENLSIYYKLEVGHPPGEPFLQLIQHLVSLLSFGNPQKAASVMNHAASTFSAMAILFLFWTTTFFARKLVERSGKLTDGTILGIMGAGVIGAGSFIFSDSVWFSAVEASVWAMSICFTSLMVWCSTKWYRAEGAAAQRWVILIFFLIGLCIGVHLLCLLFIPAAVMLYMFKTYPNGVTKPWIKRLLNFITSDPKKQGFFVAAFMAIVIVGTVKGLIIPGLINLATTFELISVNGMGLPFNSGILIYALVMAGLIIWGLKVTRKKNMPGWNTAILAFTVLVIGYCSFLLLVVRANAPTPLNEDNPSDPVSLHDYLGRKQYGDWPVLYGAYYTAPLDKDQPYKDGDPVYEKNETTKKYALINDMKGQLPNYASQFCTLFPRMWDAGESHPQGYKRWGGTDGYEKIAYTNAEGQKEMIMKPSWFGNNMAYFFKYQVLHMYFRYLMWNFCGRQNDIQGVDPADNLHGNWITGISFIDNLRNPQENMPDELAKNKARNVMYGIPLILGLIGFFYQFKKDKRDGIVVLTLFFFTGLAVMLYLNQKPYEPRERDYSDVGSFWTFSIWIGLGVLAVMNFLMKRMKQLSEKSSAIIATTLCLVVPILMCNAEWDDHDRSTRTTTRDLAIDYLESCAPNAILFTNGDNDTFPLWYAQEVEGIRTDVRVCNLELLGMAWYVDQMNRKTYESDRMPFSLNHEQYKEGTREYNFFYDRGLKGFYELKEIMDFVKSDDPNNMLQLQGGKMANFFPTRNFKVSVNKDEIIKNGMIPKSQEDSILPAITWTMKGNAVMRSTLMVLDAIANNNWKRPIYFAVTTGSEAYMNLEPYFQLEGMAYRLTPVRTTPENSIDGQRVNTGIMYNNVMKKFKWGNMNTGEYLDENVRRMAMDLRIQVATLAEALIKEGKKDSAVQVLDMCQSQISRASCPYDGPSVMIAQAYYDAHSFDKANALAKEIFDIFEKNLYYYHTLDQENQNFYGQQIQQAEIILERLAFFSQTNNQAAVAKDFQTRIEKLTKMGIIKQQ